jgi:hypothetical protein
LASFLAPFFLLFSFLAFGLAFSHSVMSVLYLSRSFFSSDLYLSFSDSEMLAQSYLMSSMRLAYPSYCFIFSALNLK